MVRSIWRRTVLGVLASTGLAWGQQAAVPSAPVSDTVGRIITVTEMGKPGQKCKILREWKMADGSTARQVEDVATGEKMTIVETSVLSTSVGGPSGNTVKSVASRIFHWGRSESAPAGTPLPPPETQAPALAAKPAAPEKKVTEPVAPPPARKTAQNTTPAAPASPYASNRTSSGTEKSTGVLPTPGAPAVAQAKDPAPSSYPMARPIWNQAPAQASTTGPSIDVTQAPAQPAQPSDWRKSWGRLPESAKKDDSSKTAAKSDATPAAAKTDAKPATVKNDATPAATKTDAKPATVKNDTTPAAAKTDAKPATAKNDATPATTKTDAKPAAVKNDTTPAATKTDAKPATVKNDTTPAATKTDAKPATAKNDAKAKVDPLTDPLPHTKVAMEEKVKEKMNPPKVGQKPVTVAKATPDAPPLLPPLPPLDKPAPLPPPAAPVAAPTAPMPTLPPAAVRVEATPSGPIMAPPVPVVTRPSLRHEKATTAAMPAPEPVGRVTVQNNEDPMMATNAQNTLHLLRIMKDSIYPSQREWAADQLADCDWKQNAPIVDALVTCAKEDPAATVRAGCVRCLSRMHVDTVPVVMAVQSLKADPDPRVRTEVVEALATLAPGLPMQAEQVIQPTKGE
jgi:hypothetical protein